MGKLDSEKTLRRNKFANDEFDIGATLKHIREDRGLTTEAMAKLCGVSRQQYYCYEKGINHPSLNNLAFMAKWIGIPTWKLIREATEDKASWDQLKEPNAKP